MKYYVIAGEASGDLHASKLLAELKKLDSPASFRCWGGDLMQQQGAQLVKHYRDLAFMGFAEVVAHLKTILKNLEFCKQDILSWNPDAVILVDYPGFNLRIAKYLKKERRFSGKIFYYISPQVWAWKPSRVATIKKYIDRMFVILPFEKEFYNHYNYEVDFVGHPLLDELEQRKEKESFETFVQRNGLSGKPVITLMPGSRKQEIQKILPIMTALTGDFPDYEFVIAGVNTIDENFYRKFCTPNEKSGAAGSIPKIIFSQTYNILEQSCAALVTSGTATLETALFGVPLAVCYKGGTISYQIAKRLVKVKYISLVNLIMEKEIVKELIQNNLTIKNLRQELHKILHDSDYRKKIILDMNELKKKLGMTAGASRKTAELIFSRITDS